MAASSRASVARYQLSRNIEPFQEINAEKNAEYIIDLPDDVEHCHISGLSITPDGRRLLTDYKNRKIKMFSRDMNIICSLSIPHPPCDIAATGDREAVVSVGISKLFILDVSDEQMSIIRTVKLSFDVEGIATWKDKLVVTSLAPSPPSVKLIDHSGEEHWSTSTDQQGQKLFSSPQYVACYDDGRSSTVIVTDWHNKKLVVLDSNTGSVISSCELNGKPRGVTTDPVGNVFVRYEETHEVAVWTRDLSEERILLTQPDGKWHSAIAYDAVDEGLLVIHDKKDQ